MSEIVVWGCTKCKARYCRQHTILEADVPEKCPQGFDDKMEWNIVRDDTDD